MPDTVARPRVLELVASAPDLNPPRRRRSMPEQLLTARDVAERFGFPSPRWVLDQARSGVMPSRKLGQAVRFYASEIQAWIDAPQHRRGPTAGARA